MKVLIEQPFEIEGLSPDHVTAKCWAFSSLIVAIGKADSEEKVKENVGLFFERLNQYSGVSFFTHGYGSNHLWVKDNISKERIILVVI